MQFGSTGWVLAETKSNNKYRQKKRENKERRKKRMFPFSYIVNN